MNFRTIQFSLRSLLLSFSILAVASALVGMYGLPGLAILATVFLVLTLAFYNSLRTVKILLFVVAAGLVWCLCVHRVLEVHFCSICHMNVFRSKYEILKITIPLEEKHIASVVTAIAEDLNCPCQHSLMNTYVRYDDWGTYFRYPQDNLYYGFLPENDGSYSKYLRPIVKKLLDEQPDLAEEFCSRVMEQQDEDYWEYFHDKVLKIPEIDRAIIKEREGKNLSE